MVNELGDLSEVTRRLDIIINLLLDIKAEDTSKRTKIQELAGMGLSPAEIGDIVGWSASSVSSELSKIKKAKKGGKRR